MGLQTHELNTTSAEGETTWMLNNLGATDGLKVLTQLIALVGEGVGELGGDRGSGETDIMGMKISPDMIFRAVGAISKNVAQPGTIDMIKTLLRGLRKNGAAIPNFDLEFSGRYKLLLIDLVPWALRVNFADFFDGSAGALGMLERLRPEASSKTRTSTGGSSES